MGNLGGGGGLNTHLNNRGLKFSSVCVFVSYIGMVKLHSTGSVTNLSIHVNNS